MSCLVLLICTPWLLNAFSEAKIKGHETGNEGRKGTAEHSQPNMRNGIVFHQLPTRSFVGFGRGHLFLWCPSFHFSCCEFSFSYVCHCCRPFYFHVFFRSSVCPLCLLLSIDYFPCLSCFFCFPSLAFLACCCCFPVLSTLCIVCSRASCYCHTVSIRASLSFASFSWVEMACCSLLSFSLLCVVLRSVFFFWTW